MNELLIDPKKLAERTKESSMTVSLRIKETTWLGFEHIAKKYGTTTNALIAELADYYISSVRMANIHEEKPFQVEKINYYKFKLFLEKEARKLSRWTVSDSVLESYMEYVHSSNLRNASNLEKVKRVFKKISISMEGLEFVNIEALFGASIDKNTVIYPTLKQEASYSTSPWDPAYSVQDVLFVPLEKEPDVKFLIRAAKTNAEKNRLQLKFDIDVFDKIVSCINHHNYDYREEKIEEKVGSGNTTSTIIHNKEYYNKDERSAMIMELTNILQETAENNERNSN